MQLSIRYNHVAGAAAAADVKADAAVCQKRAKRSRYGQHLQSRTFGKRRRRFELIWKIRHPILSEKLGLQRLLLLLATGPCLPAATNCTLAL